MYYFDAILMSPVRTETMINLKPVRRYTWSYRAVKAWYFAPSLKQYCVIKTTNDAGMVRTTDTWKYNHHPIKNTTVTPVERIIKAKKHWQVQYSATTMRPKMNYRRLSICELSSQATTRQSATKPQIRKLNPRAAALGT